MTYIAADDSVDGVAKVFYESKDKNAIFRLGFLPAVAGHGVAFSVKRPLGLP